ncbi:hypothetical protein IGL98_001346 [Enterococcus sp. DIV0840]|uniref:hypothetical protein n=1 Tax=Enterococcus TaxID=1350 RepID=UPI001A8F9986|nr:MULTISPECIES: hypothetical protein [Enterococcus]MBO0435211.1 hypothetical protein [Enterococcus sp. DIV0849a]MBO0474434.1 hypothetical protein [Enterococcus ureasiticus]
MVLEKIYRGMENGAETIQGNFSIIENKVEANTFDFDKNTKLSTKSILITDNPYLTEGRFTFKRIGRMVTLSIIINLKAKAEWQSLLSKDDIPIGFLPVSFADIAGPLSSVSNVGSFANLYMNATGLRIITNGVHHSGQFQGSYTYMTAQEFPATES